MDFENIQGKITAISAGGFHTLYLLRDGRACGSGRNDFGQIEIDNSMIDTHVSQNNQGNGLSILEKNKGKELGWFFTGRKTIAISAGYNHSLVLYNDGVVKG